MGNSKLLTVILLGYLAILMLPQKTAMTLFFIILSLWTVILVLNFMNIVTKNKMYIIIWIITGIICAAYTLITFVF